MIIHPLSEPPAGPGWTASDPDSPASGMQVCDVRVELSDRISDDEIRGDLAADPAHWLLEFSPAVAATSTGRVSVGLMVPGPDLWTAALTAMAVLRRSGYDLQFLSVENRLSNEDQPTT